MAHKVSYFSPGPAKLPDEVLYGLQKELVHYADTNVSVMELSHRSKDFDKIIKGAEALIRELMGVPDNYKVLFLQGGGFGQFATVPLNLISKTGKASYMVTGSWSETAFKECKKYGEALPVFKKLDKYTQIPPKETWTIDPESSYVYYCSNETVNGVEFQYVPEIPEGIPLVCDMSSNICSRPVDVSKFGVIYGGAQKNVGCSGVTLVIVREDLLGKSLTVCPSVFDYTIMAKQNSLMNTPPTFAIHVLGRVFSWIKESGGIKVMEERAIEKSSLLYSTIDSSNNFYFNAVNKDCRSRMNVIFRLGGPDGNEELEKKFVEEALKNGLLSLKGHRSVGGIRASVYNAVTVEDVKRLTDFMKKFMTNQ